MEKAFRALAPYAAADKEALCCVFAAGGAAPDAPTTKQLKKAFKKSLAAHDHAYHHTVTLMEALDKLLAEVREVGAVAAHMHRRALLEAALAQ